MKLLSLFHTTLAIIAEYFLVLKNHILSLTLREPPAEWGKGKKGTIILIPGFSETWIFLKTIADHLNKKGYRISVVESLGRNIHSVNEEAEKVKAFILRSDFQDVILLSHSKGGVIAKKIVSDKEVSPRIKKLISIASPYGGTLLGKLHFFSLNEHKPTSPVTKEVKQPQEENKKIINLYPLLDNHVIPNQHLFLDKATNIQVKVKGHTRILEDEATLKAIDENL